MAGILPRHIRCPRQPQAHQGCAQHSEFVPAQRRDRGCDDQPGHEQPNGRQPVQRAPFGDRPTDPRGEPPDQCVALLRPRDRGYIAQRTRLALRAVVEHRRAHFQRAPAEQPVQHAFAQRPRLDASARRAGADAGEQAAFKREPAAVFFQPETAVLQQRDEDREQPDHHDEQHDHRHQRHDLVAAAVAFDHAEHAPGQRFEDAGDQIGADLRQRRQSAADDDHAAVGDQPDPDHIRNRERQQDIAALVGGRRNARAIAGGRRSGATAAHQRLQRQRIVEREHTHFGFGLDPAGRLQPDFGHAEDAVQQCLMQTDVVNPRERNLPQAALQQAAADLQTVHADAEAVGVVLPERNRPEDADRHQPPQVVAVATPEQEQHRDRHDELPELLHQHEQPRHRVQPAFGLRFDDGVVRRGKRFRRRRGHRLPGDRSVG